MSNISAVLYSNSGLVPLVNRKYTLQFGKEETLEGTTDDEGYLQHLSVPPGDYTLTIGEVTCFVPTVADPNERLPIRCRGYLLVQEDEETQSEFDEEDQQPIDKDDEREEDEAFEEWEDLDEVDNE